jgi:hypothetical protein
MPRRTTPSWPTSANGSVSDASRLMTGCVSIRCMTWTLTLSDTATWSSVSGLPVFSVVVHKINFRLSMAVASNLRSGNLACLLQHTVHCISLLLSHSQGGAPEEEGGARSDFFVLETLNGMRLITVFMGGCIIIIIIIIIRCSKHSRACGLSPSSGSSAAIVCVCSSTAERQENMHAVQRLCLHAFTQTLCVSSPCVWVRGSHIVKWLDRCGFLAQCPWIED